MNYAVPLILDFQIKKIEASKNTCSTLTTRGGVGLTDGQLTECQFNEPGGLALHPHKRLLYVADTNNHRIRVINLEKNTCSTVCESSCYCENLTYRVPHLP